MALIVMPEGTQVSGSIGGTTFSHNRFGAYKRNRSVPVNPNTDRQVVVRNAVRALTIAWNNTLTEVEREAWNVYAANVSWVNRLGQSVKLTGINQFVRSNTPLIQNGKAQIADAPILFNIAAAEGLLTCSASEGTQDASVGFDTGADWVGENDAFQFVYGGIPKNASTTFFNGPWRLMGLIEGDSITPPTSPATIAWPFPFAEGQRLWVRTRIARADGRLSEFARVNFLGAA